MEQNNAKFRLRLNLFDCIVILLALALGGLLLWRQMRPAAEVQEAEKVRYTIVLKQALEGTGELVHPGDALVDSVKNYQLGQAVDSWTEPATKSIVDEDARAYVTATIPGYEDVYIQVESTATITDEKVLVGGGYTLMVDDEIFVRGPGYIGSGRVYAIERED